MSPDFGLSELILQARRDKKRLDDLSFAADDAQSEGMKAYLDAQRQENEAMRKHNAVLEATLVSCSKKAIEEVDKKAVTSLALCYYKHRLEEN